MSSATHPTVFASRVRAEMAAQNLKIRTLARRMDPQNIDRARRNLHRWLDEGITPNRTSRREVAAALTLPEDTFDADDDSEAARAMTLDAFLRIRVREILTEERKQRSYA